MGTCTIDTTVLWFTQSTFRSELNNPTTVRKICMNIDRPEVDALSTDLLLDTTDPAKYDRTMASLHCAGVKGQASVITSGCTFAYNFKHTSNSAVPPTPSPPHPLNLLTPSPPHSFTSSPTQAPHLCTWIRKFQIRLLQQSPAASFPN